MVVIFIAGLFKALREEYAQKKDEREKGSVADTLLGGAPPRRSNNNPDNYDSHQPQDILEQTLKYSEYANK